MRSLNTSLPTSSPKLRTTQPPEHLLQAFKTAALSVTNLYKTAVTDLDQVGSRQAGYQDALDDLLTFLDRQNLGLGDGEGWKVRQWATERLNGAVPAQASSDNDDERGETDQRAESPSPVIQRKTTPELPQNRSSTRSASPVRAEHPAATPIPTQQNTTSPLKNDRFTFRSSITYPQDIDMQASEQGPNSLALSDKQTQLSAPTSTPALRLEVVPRGSRTPHRHGSHSGRHNTRSANTTKSLGSGAGSKRKIAFGEFFDIGSLGDMKDGFGGGSKRGRLG